MTPERLREIARELGDIVAQKNEAYGNSVIVSAQFLELLWPDGVPVHAYNDLLLVARIIDKLKRIANRKDAFGESPYLDLSGYGVLGYAKDLEVGIDSGQGQAGENSPSFVAGEVLEKS